eukprot:570418-Rhodomonas_salina.1
MDRKHIFLQRHARYLIQAKNHVLVAPFAMSVPDIPLVVPHAIPVPDIAERAHSTYWRSILHLSCVVRADRVLRSEDEPVLEEEQLAVGALAARV